MSKHNKDILRKIILGDLLDKPTADFKERVMQDVYAEAKGEALVHAALKSVLQKTIAETLPSNFTHTVLARIGTANKNKSPEPIISKKAWISAVIIFFLLVSLCLATETAKSHQLLTPYLTELGDGVISFLNRVNTLPPVLLLTLISIFLLLIGDYYLKNWRYQK